MPKKPTNISPLNPPPHPSSIVHTQADPMISVEARLEALEAQLKTGQWYPVDDNNNLLIKTKQDLALALKDLDDYRNAIVPDLRAQLDAWQSKANALELDLQQARYDYQTAREECNLWNNRHMLVLSDLLELVESMKEHLVSPTLSPNPPADKPDPSSPSAQESPETNHPSPDTELQAKPNTPPSSHTHSSQPRHTDGIVLAPRTIVLGTPRTAAAAQAIAAGQTFGLPRDQQPDNPEEHRK